MPTGGVLERQLLTLKIPNSEVEHEGKETGQVNMVLLDNKKGFADFVIKERRIYGEPDPEPRLERYTKSQIQNLPILDLTQKQNSNLVYDYLPFRVFDVPIVWERQINHEGISSGYDVDIFGPYRLPMTR